MKQYTQIVFQQGEEAEQALRILEESGEEAAISYLSQWDDGDNGEVTYQSAAGDRDTQYRDGKHLLTYSLKRGYIGLEIVKPIDWETYHPPKLRCVCGGNGGTD